MAQIKLFHVRACEKCCARTKIFCFNIRKLFSFFNSGSSFHTQAVVSWRHGGLLLSENIFLDRKMAKQYVYRFAVNWLYLRRLSKICVLKTSDP